MINKERLINEFITMAKIASPSRKEGKFAAYLAEQLRDLGLEVIIDDEAGRAAGSDAGNIIGRLPGNSSHNTSLFFAAHMDTVSPGEGIKPVIKHDIIYSSGDTVLGSDDKSGIAGVLEVLRHIKEEKVAHGDIEVVFTVGEEIGLLGSKFLDYSLLKSKIGFVLDSGGEPGTIIKQAPAEDSITAIIKGKAAHAGVNPEDGISAIQVAARAINNMKLLRVDEETTSNIGVISGGVATNIVCDKVSLEGEARSLKDDKLAKQTQHMVDCLQEACSQMGAHLELNVTRSYSAFNLSEDEAIIKIAKEAGRKLNLPVKVASSGGGSDTNYFNAHGIKAVNLGTGMSKVHTTEEFIRINDLVNITRYIFALIQEATQS